MKSSIILLTLIGLTTAIVHDHPIDRPKTILNLPEDKKFDLSKYETSLVRIVDPAPMCSLVQTLKVHSEPYLNTFLSTHKKAVTGGTVLYGKSYEKQAQDAYNVLLQDFFPMNEADAAAARFFFSIDTCKIKSDSAVPQGMTACKYHGARLLSDIVRRVAPIHSLLTLGTADILPGQVKKSVPMTTPREWNEQLSRIVSIFNSDEISGYLKTVDATSATIWEDIRSRTTKNNNL